MAENGTRLIKPHLLLDLPATPKPVHNGAVVIIGPDNYVYTVIGDVDLHRNPAQNKESGNDVDGTSGILRITPDGEPVDPCILGDTYPLNLYYAYGIRNSFGIDFDPVTGKLWDTENGDSYGDEINLVDPGLIVAGESPKESHLYLRSIITRHSTLMIYWTLAKENIVIQSFHGMLL